MTSGVYSGAMNGLTGTTPPPPAHGKILHKGSSGKNIYCGIIHSNSQNKPTWKFCTFLILSVACGILLQKPYGIIFCSIYYQNLGSMRLGCFKNSHSLIQKLSAKIGQFTMSQIASHGSPNQPFTLDHSQFQVRAQPMANGWHPWYSAPWVVNVKDWVVRGSLVHISIHRIQSEKHPSQLQHRLGFKYSP